MSDTESLKNALTVPRSPVLQDRTATAILEEAARVIAEAHLHLQAAESLRHRLRRLRGGSRAVARGQRRELAERQRLGFAFHKKIVPDGPSIW